ncbi:MULTISPECIES: hypothetical protein [Frankia]|uniref:hypothetical protein n=1 Tax=Frankia TaxID=1854 RepID=UPI0006EBF9E0|nr:MULTISPECIES: hypothetical protein [Frankia]
MTAVVGHGVAGVAGLPAVLADAGRVLVPGGRFALAEPLHHARRYDDALPGLTAHEQWQIDTALGQATPAHARHAVDDLVTASHLGHLGLEIDRGDLAPTTTTLRDHDAVAVHLHTPPVPAGPNPLEAVRGQLGELLAGRYETACHQLLDDRGTVTIRTPTVYLSARRARAGRR